VARWWVVPGTTAGVIAAIAAHPPTGFDSCTGACPQTTGAITELSLWPQDDDTGTTSIGVTLQQAAGHVDVRVVGRSIWEPERSGWEHIPATVRSVYLSLRPSGETAPGQPAQPVNPKSGTVSAAGATQLAALLNQSPAAWVQPAPAGCYDGGTRVTARFRLGGNTLTFSWTNGNCGWIYPTYNGKAQPTLYGDPLPLVERLLHMK
jgi:hypothetical protein